MVELDLNRLIVKQLSIVLNNEKILDSIDFTIPNQGHLAIVGSSGSGKTTLAKALANKMFYKGTIQFHDSIKKILFVHQINLFKNKSSTADFYYQQRYNSLDVDDTYTVAEQLIAEGFSIDTLSSMRIEYLAERSLLKLSNGENKKLQLAKVLAQDPDVLLLDQPFVGLDRATRLILHEKLNSLAQAGVMIILITGRDEIPSCISHILHLTHGKIDLFVPKEFYLSGSNTQSIFSTEKPVSSSSINVKHNSIIVGLKHVTIQYGEKMIINNISWTVRKGEKWLLKGHNGAGKTTLLSLITADNPQAYAHDITIFDQQRGTGESIWDIKSKIGFVSPELHLYFEKDTSFFNAVASGFFDSIGLFRKLSNEQKIKVDDWISSIGYEKWKDKKMYELSYGIQRIALVLRAIIKSPPLLILDEPCQGIDDNSKDLIIRMIDTICVGQDMTLIYVSHFENEIPDCIDHLLELADGKVIKNEKL